MTNINKGLLHRAFSVFLFDPQTKKLLLQQRATEKITFPDQWTNTCCSHPLHTTSELGFDLPTSIAGVKRAAQRKLDHELGIKVEQVPTENMKFLTRIHYLSPSGQGIWGEHESMVLKLSLLILVDYIIIILADVDLDVNPNEVRDTRYVSPEELKEMFKQKGIPIAKTYANNRPTIHTMVQPNLPKIPLRMVEQSRQSRQIQWRTGSNPPNGLKTFSTVTTYPIKL